MRLDEAKTTLQNLLTDDVDTFTSNATLLSNHVSNTSDLLLRNLFNDSHQTEAVIYRYINILRTLSDTYTKEVISKMIRIVTTFSVIVQKLIDLNLLFDPGTSFLGSQLLSDVVTLCLCLIDKFASFYRVRINDNQDKPPTVSKDDSDLIKSVYGVLFHLCSFYPSAFILKLILNQSIIKYANLTQISQYACVTLQYLDFLFSLLSFKAYLQFEDAALGNAVKTFILELFDVWLSRANDENSKSRDLVLAKTCLKVVEIFRLFNRPIFFQLLLCNIMQNRWSVLDKMKINYSVYMTLATEPEFADCCKRICATVADLSQVLESNAPKIKMSQAAIKIQACYRGFRVRKRMEKQLKMRKRWQLSMKKVIVIIRWWKGRRYEARMTELRRSLLVNDKALMHEMRLSTNISATPSRQVDRYLVSLEERAARKIQRCWRQSKQPPRTSRRLLHAVLRIQRWYRAILAKRHRADYLNNIRTFVGKFYNQRLSDELRMKFLSNIQQFQRTTPVLPAQCEHSVLAANQTCLDEMLKSYWIRTYNMAHEPSSSLLMDNFRKTCNTMVALKSIDQVAPVASDWRTYRPTVVAVARQQHLSHMKLLDQPEWFRKLALQEGLHSWDTS